MTFEHEPAIPRSVICVLGMHRSGTSLVAQALNLLGVDLGPRSHVMAPRLDNPRGFFEHQLLSDLNEEILVRFGGGWHTPPSLPNGWESTPALQDLRERARQLLEEDFGLARVWGWKDPRTCLTLPFWQQLLPAMRYVVCVRSPLDVARSLEVRDGFSIERAISLWGAYMRGALMNSSGRPRLFVSYDDFIDQSESEVARMALFVGGTVISEESARTVKASIDATLRHHHTAAAHATCDTRLPHRVEALHHSLKLIVKSQQVGVGSDGEPVSTMAALWERAIQDQADEQRGLGQHLGQQLMDLKLAVHDLAAEAGRLKNTLNEQERAQIEAGRTEAKLREGLQTATEAARDLRLELRQTSDSLQVSLRDVQALESERASLAGHLTYVETPAGCIRLALRTFLPRRLFNGLRRAQQSWLGWSR